MSTLSEDPLILFQVLADRHGKPAALLFDVDGVVDDALLELTEDDNFVALSNAFPCLHRSALAPVLAEALQLLNWTVIDAASLARVDGALDKNLAPSVAWVCGDWCTVPPAKAQGPQAASRALALQLVQLVSADADTHEIEAMLRQDPTLSYHLIRLVNSLGMGASRRITSFSQAILILGRQQLRRWLNLMLFAARQSDVRSAMLLARVAVRARALESLAKQRGLDKTTQEQAFMTGMFSLLGVLFGMSLAEVIAPLAISDAVQSALLHHDGELGVLLQLVEAAERGDAPALRAALGDVHIAPDDYNLLMAGACFWMLGVVRESSGHA